MAIQKKLKDLEITRLFHRTYIYLVDGHEHDFMDMEIYTGHFHEFFQIALGEEGVQEEDYEYYFKKYSAKFQRAFFKTVTDKYPDLPERLIGYDTPDLETLYYGE